MRLEWSVGGSCWKPLGIVSTVEALLGLSPWTDCVSVALHEATGGCAREGVGTVLPGLWNGDSSSSLCVTS